jgi:hypothetical protein
MALYVHPVDERDRAAAERLGALLPKSANGATTGPHQKQIRGKKTARDNSRAS